MSPIDKIHSEGFVAIINVDDYKIVGKVKPDEVKKKVEELRAKYEVVVDHSGDICIWKE